MILLGDSSQMTDGDYKSLFKKALAYGIKAGLGSDAEDFAQECLIQAHKVGAIRFEYVYCNYRDAQRAHKRVLSAPEGALNNFRTRSTSTPLGNEGDDSGTLEDLLGSTDSDLGTVGDIEFYKHTYARSDRDREIIDLASEGCGRNEIAEHIGVSPSRISQVMTAMRKRDTNDWLLRLIKNEETRLWLKNFLASRLFETLA